MAPNRRKSKAPSAAAAAAARQKWKVGDLVLAKVKGFPAWPATISEPEKWGYKPDSKKVLVFFFGTNQIAFCSPVDVEAFTEEKKLSLQGKRYGKSADFVRAVQEIIESYNKLITQAQGDDLDCGVDVTMTHPPPSVGSLVSPGKKDLTHNASEPLILQENGPVWTKDELEASPTLEDAVSVKAENQNSLNITTICETPPESSNVSIKRPVGMNSQANVNQRRAPSTRRSRTSRIDLHRQQDTELPSEDCSAGIGNIVSSALCNGSPQEDEKYMGPSHLDSNPIPEDNTSGIASLDNSVNRAEGSSFDSTCLPEHIGTARNLNINVELDKKHGLDLKAVFVKKKRKSNRKRFAVDSPDLTPVDKVADSVSGVHDYRLNSPNACEKSNESPSKVDGDEYLPLVKRARVRMGKLADVECHADTLMLDVEEKSTNGCNLDVSNGLSMNSLNNYSSNEQNLGIMKEPTGGSVALADCTILAIDVQRDYSCKGPPCDKMDGETGLPPSKRFNQALGAMSVNAHEDSQLCVADQLPKTSDVILSSASALVEAAAKITGIDTSDDPLGNSVNTAFNNDMEIDLSTNTPVVNSPCIRESNIPSIETAETNQCNGSSPALVEAGIRNALHDGSGVICLPLETEERKHSTSNNQFSGDQSLQYNVKKSSDSSCASAEPPDHKISSSDSTEISKCVVRKDGVDTSKVLHYTDPEMCREDEIFRNEILQLPLNEKMPAHTMSELDGELKLNLSLKSGTLVEVADAQHDSLHLDSVANEHFDEKVVLGVQTSPSSVSDPVQPSPMASSFDPISSTPKGSNLQNNGFVCSADKLLVKREEGTLNTDAGSHGTLGSSGKVKNSVEAKATLTSFGNALGTLTRTKDSIGRATRMAIECAKAGLAVKVVDILSRTLENESNLNRKVDLFFLVDSMMQCSRGLKGEVGGIYPSAIQSALPRLLSAAAGNAASENRRQCLKVLKLWLERRILPDSVIRHHMQNLDSFSNFSYSSGPFSRRSARTERAFHDPLREMEGMLVDEYGSNSSFQLSGFCMPRMRKDDSDGSDSDGESFEAVTPEHKSGTAEGPECPTGERHRHILEDVDGELEMEDVAPSEAEMNSSSDVRVVSSQISTNEANVTSFCAPLPNDLPPSSPPLPTSPPPPHVHPPPRIPRQNHSMSVPPLQPPPSVHSLPPPQPVCPPHGHSLPLASAHHLPPHPSVNPIPPSAAGCLHPMYPPIPVHPSTDMIANGVDLVPYGIRNNSVDNLPPVSPRTRLTYGDSMDYRVSDRHNTQREMGAPEPSTSCSFDSYSGPRHAAHPNNDVRHSGCSTYDSRAYNARPPPLGPSNNLSHVQGDHRGHHSWREGPPNSYSNNYHREPGRNCYDDHNWRKPGPQEPYEDRRYYGPPFPGDKVGGPYPPHPYVGPSNEHNRGRQGWGYPPREMHHRNSMPVRPSSEGPRYWRQW